MKYAVAASFILAPVAAIIFVLTGGNNATDRAPQPLSTTLSEALLTGPMAAFTPAEPGQMFPDIAFKDESGESITLKAFRGKTVLVNFWATWCAPCLKEMPSLDRLQAAFKGANFQVVTISIDRTGSDVVRPFFVRKEIKHLTPYYDAENSVGRAVGALGLPTSLLVDADGREIGRLVAPAEWDSPEAVALIQNSLDK